MSNDVTPLVGVWIEMYPVASFPIGLSVTPLVGVWIEIGVTRIGRAVQRGHSPCGSVD